MKAKVNDRFEYLLSEQNGIEFLGRHDNHYQIRFDKKIFHVELLEFQHREKKVQLSMDGFVFEVKLSLPLDEIILDIRSQLSTEREGKEFIAPIPGVIKSLNGIPGGSVQKGEVLLVLEAMKMENTILATTDGDRLTYHVAPGENVVKGQILCSLD